MARLSNWNGQIGLYLEENEAQTMGLREGTRVDMDVRLPTVYVRASPRGTLSLHRSAESTPEPWKIVQMRENEEGYTRFGPTVVEPENIGGAFRLELTEDAEALCWPIYVTCSSYKIPVEVGLDYLQRACLLGRVPKCPEGVLKVLPSIVRNYARAGKSEQALALLRKYGEAFLRGEVR